MNVSIIHISGNASEKKAGSTKTVGLIQAALNEKIIAESSNTGMIV